MYCRKYLLIYKQGQFIYHALKQYAQADEHIIRQHLEAIKQNEQKQYS